MAGTDDVVVKVSADTADLEAAMKRATASVRDSVQAMTGQVGDLSASLDSIAGKLNVAFAYEVVTKAWEAITHVVDALDQLALASIRTGHTADIVGITRSELQGMQAAASEAGVGADQLSSAMLALELRLQQARDKAGPMRDKMAAVGITLDDLKDKNFSTASAMYRMSESAATNDQKLDAVGKRAIVLLETMQNLAGGTDAARVKAEALGATTEQEAYQLEQLHKAVTDAELRWKYFETRIVAGVAPALTALITSFGELIDVTKTSDTSLDRVGEVSRAIAKEFYMLAENIKEAWLNIKQFFGDLDAAATNVEDVLSALWHRHFSEAKQIWQAGTKELVALDKAHDEQIVDARAKMAVALRVIDESILQEFRASMGEADKIKVGEREGVKPAKEPKEPIVREHVFDEPLKDSQKYFDELRKMQEEQALIFRDTQVGEISEREKSLAEQLKLGEIGGRDYITQENALIDRRLQAEETYLQRKMELDRAAGLDTLKLEDEIVKAEVAAQKQREAAQIAAEQAMLARWRTVTSQLESSLTSSLQGMIRGTETFTTAMRNLFTSMVDSIIGMIIRMGVQWAETMIMKRVIGAATAKSQIATSAGEAGAAGVASFAQAPWPIDIGAPAFGAAMALDAAAYSVAARGYDVPATLNPLTQLHASEMVLPQRHADVIRGLADNGSGAPAPQINLHMNVQAMDAGSFHDYAMKQSHVFVDAIQRELFRLNPKLVNAR